MRLVDVRAEQRGGIGAPEPAQLEPDERAGSARPLDGARQTLRELPRPGADREQHRRRGRAAVGARRAARPRRCPPSARRPAPTPRASSPPGAPAAPAPRGARDSARPEPSARPAPRGPTATGRPARARRGPHRRARRAGAARARRRTRRARPRTSQKGRSSSSSDALPASTTQPLASPRAASSASKRVFPMPGSPTTATAVGSPRLSPVSASSRELSSAARPTRCSRTLASLGFPSGRASQLRGARRKPGSPIGVRPR